MKAPNLLLFFFMIFFLFSFPVLSEEDEVVFELKREEKKPKQKQIKRKKPLPPRFKRHSFTYNKDFVVYNKKPKSHLKPGTTLRINIPYPVIACYVKSQ